MEKYKQQQIKSEILLTTKQIVAKEVDKLDYYTTSDEIKKKVIAITLIYIDVLVRRPKCSP